MNILETVMLLWINKDYNPKHVMFVQDSDLFTKPKLSKKQLPLFVLKHAWHSSSPNLMLATIGYVARLKRYATINFTTWFNL